MATALAAVGALVMSGGVVMLGASTAAAESCDPSPAYTETTDWVTTSPGEGWYHVEERNPGHGPVPECWSPLPALQGGSRSRPTYVVHLQPCRGNDQAVTTGYPVGDRAADKDNGWHGQPGAATPDSTPTELAVGVPWQEPQAADRGSRGPHGHARSAAEYEYMRALEPPGDGWSRRLMRVIQEYVPATCGDRVQVRRYHPAITCPDQPDPVVMPLSDQRMTCAAGVESRTGTQTTTYVWNAETRTYDPVVGSEVWGAWTFVRALTDAEFAQLGCQPGQPDPVVAPLATSR